MESLDANPVFVTGFGKSGTTLLLSLLDGHPDLCVFPREMRFFDVVREQLEADKEDGLDRFFRRFFFKTDFGMEDAIDVPIDRKEYAKVLRARWRSGGNKISSFMSAAVLAYGEVSGQRERKWWVEKTPTNEKNAKLLAQWHPNLKMIYVVRDPRANYSAFRLYRERIREPINTARFIKEWQRSVRAGLSTRYSDFLILRYEDVVTDPEIAMGTVCEYLDINFSETMLVPTLVGKPFSGNSGYRQSFSGVSSESLVRWRTTLSQSEITQIQSLLGRWMRQFSYEFEETVGGGDHIDVAWARLLVWIYKGYDLLPSQAKQLYRTMQGR